MKTLGQTSGCFKKALDIEPVKGGIPDTNVILLVTTRPTTGNTLLWVVACERHQGVRAIADKMKKDDKVLDEMLKSNKFLNDELDPTYLKGELDDNAESLEQTIDQQNHVAIVEPICASKITPSKRNLSEVDEMIGDESAKLAFDEVVIVHEAAIASVAQSEPSQIVPNNDIGLEGYSIV
ncbi:hypothetical protein ACFE04_024175 [Oxalis oulophora]